MEKAQDYFDREYDGNHIATVVDMFDLKSLYGLMEEYAGAQVEKPNVIPDVIDPCTQWIPDKGTSATRCANCGKDRWAHDL